MLRASITFPRRRRGKKKKRPAPEGLSLAELAERAGVTPRTVRYYLERGVLPSPAFHSRRTRYERHHLVRLFAIIAMKKERLDLAAIRRRLTTLSSEQLEAYVPARPTPSAPSPLAPAPSSSMTQASERWERIALLPGVELHLRSDASPLVRRIVQEIVDGAARS
jgi:DNA-binding transcriptional MerR regulator